MAENAWHAWYAALACAGRNAETALHGLRTRLICGRRPVVGWNPRLERVTNG